MPKISVIVPIYNVERYVRKCIESIAFQSFSDYEVILINDGSTDASASIVSDFIEEKQLTNFSLVNKENGVVSSARNLGLDLAKGRWVAFVDGDDWLETEYLSVLIKAAEETFSDICVCGYQAVDDQTQEIVWQNLFKPQCGVLPEDLAQYNVFSVIYGRLYRKDIIETNHIRFDDRIKYCEDNAFNYDYACSIKHFCFIGDVEYNYRINRVGALTNKPVHPRVKYYLHEHMKTFADILGYENIKCGLKANNNLARVMWNALSTAVINDILDNRYKIAYKRKRTDLAIAIFEAYSPRTKKDRLFMAVWKRSFVCLCLLVKVYYRFFETLRNSRLIRILSQARR